MVINSIKNKKVVEHLIELSNDIENAHNLTVLAASSHVERISEKKKNFK